MEQGRKNRSGACGRFLSVMNAKGAAHHFPVNCECWHCPHCVETILRRRLTEHLLKVAATEGKLFYSRVPLSDWRRVYESLKRGLYFRVVIDKTVHLFCRKPRGERMAGKGLDRLLQTLVNHVPYTSCPFSSCRAWAMKQARPVPKGYVSLGMTSIGIQAMKAAAEQHGIRTRYTGEALTLCKVDKATVLAIRATARTIQASTVKCPNTRKADVYDISRWKPQKVVQIEPPPDVPEYWDALRRLFAT